MSVKAEARYTRGKKIKTAAIILTAAALIFAVYVIISNTLITVTEYDISSDRIPESFDGFRIVQISDFHNSGNKWRNDIMLSEVKEISPDAIFLTGDIIDRVRTDYETSLDMMEKLSEIAPMYYVTGNHEARTEQSGEFLASLRGLGVYDLNDATMTIRRGNDEIILIGLNDPWMYRKDGISESENTETRLKKLSCGTDCYSVLLTHRPELMDIYAGCGVDLAFAGHAHGGLIRLPFIGGIYAPQQGFFPKYDNGVYRQDTTTMIVSRGVGNNGHTFRINDSPEIVVAVLHAG